MLRGACFSCRPRTLAVPLAILLIYNYVATTGEESRLQIAKQMLAALPTVDTALSSSPVASEISRSSVEVDEPPKSTPASSGAATQEKSINAKFLEHVKTNESMVGFRVYVHTLSQKFDHINLVKRFPSCKAWQWANDFKLIKYLLESPLRTENAAEADFLFVPFLAKCWFNNVAKYNLDSMDRDVKEMLEELKGTDSWRVRPERHVFAFVSGVGPTLFRSWRSIRKAIFVLAEGDRAANIYDDARDIIIPGVSAVASVPRSRDPHRSRRLLATFRGSLIAHVRDETGKDSFRRSLLRLALTEFAKGREDLAVGDKIYSDSSRKTYLKELEDSKFCIIPRGLTPWTRRLFDALLSDCVPVVLSNAIVFPFERTLDFTKFTLKIPEAWVGRLWSLLDNIESEDLWQLQRGVRLVAHHFAALNGRNPMESVLEELSATRRASQQGRQLFTNNSEHNFWMPGRGVFQLHGNDARQVGPSWGAGAIPHPREQDLWEPDEQFKNAVGGNLEYESGPPKWWWKVHKKPKGTQ